MKTIDDMVYGHKQAKKVIQAVLNRSQDRYYRKCIKGESDYLQTLKCLLIGPSGTGKTHLVQSYKELYKFPLIYLDATQLMPSGNDHGVNIKQLKKLIDDTCQQLTKTPQYHSPEGVLNQLIIYVDEFDKLGNCFESSGAWNKHVQANFLTMIDNKDEFAGISWIFTGAFSELFKNKNNSNSIGFFTDNKSEHIENEITDKDIIKSGIIPEMLGRINLIAQLDIFTEEDYKKILTERLLPNYPALIDINIDIMVTKAIKSEQGIRSLTRQLEMLAIDAEYEANPIVVMKNSF
jgi:ATP-dependent Clp protease ATP-binding subunit ClpX